MDSEGNLITILLVLEKESNRAGKLEPPWLLRGGSKRAEKRELAI